MASAKRKQDEKNLKVLRELVSQPCNKECFDCRQRGPTYVNMTIGSFVCTSCSGILRGLTPPHRVKSISMATFTQEEINFIKQRGNKHCEQIWLGLMNSGESLAMDVKDEQKIKDLMHVKYELKRYYLEPSMLDQNQLETKKPDNSGKSNASRIPSSSGIRLSNPSRTSSDTESRNTDDFTTNFVADFSKISESLSTAAVSDKFNNAFVSQPAFANFDNNPAFITVKSTTEIQAPLYTTIGRSTAVTVNEADAPPSEDRYAALKDLDSLMKQTKLNEGTTMNTSTWNPNNSISNSIWGMEAPSAHLIPNPFSSTDLWKPATNIFNNNIHADNTLSNSGNPFKSAQPSVYNESDMMGVETSNLANVIQLSQMRTPLNKVWQSTLPTHHANPFIVHPRTNITNNSNNPFL